MFSGADPAKPRTRQALWKDIKRAARACRLTANAAPHSMRKVCAVELLRQYGNIDRVRRALNHGSVEVTMIYAMADKRLRAKGKRRRASPGRKKARQLRPLLVVSAPRQTKRNLNFVATEHVREGAGRRA